MNDLILQYVIPALLGLCGGILGSLVAPWVQWSIEKRREQFKHRREKIEKWRAMVEKHIEVGDLNNSVVYSELRPHLSKEVTDAVEGQMITIRMGRGGDVIKGLILDDIKRIEKEWGLL